MLNHFKIIVVSLALIVLSTLSSPTTLSFFTDTASAENTFVVGHAATTLSVYDDISSEPYRPFSPDHHPPLTEGLEIPLYLQAENTGNIPVYHRFRITLPVALTSVLELNIPNCTLENNTCETPDYTVTFNPAVSSADPSAAPAFAEYYLVSTSILEPGATTSPWPTESLLVGNLDDLDPSILTCENSDANACAFGLSFHSDVIQTTGFPDSASAFSNFAQSI